MTNQDYILITGIGGPAGESAVAYFREKGFPVIGTDIRKVKTSAESFYIIPPTGEPSFLTTLMDIIKKERPSLKAWGRKKGYASGYYFYRPDS